MVFDYWHYWIIAAFVFFLLEVFIPGFILGSIGIGCLLATLGALFDLPVWLNVVFLIFGFLVGISMLKPLLNKMEKSSNIKTNAEGLIGKIGKVSEKIDMENGKGCVHVDGDDWKAIVTSNEIIEVGTLVEIVALESIVVTVRALQKEVQQDNNFVIESPIAETLQNNKGLIISIGNKKEIVHHNEILCVFSNQKITYLIKSDEKRFVVDESLEKLEERLGNQIFFRANRQFIITNQIVKEYKTKSDGKIEIKLKPLPNLSDSISVSRLKAHAFRKWVEKTI